jgi:signal transduction histidine kinase
MARRYEGSVEPASSRGLIRARTRGRSALHLREEAPRERLEYGQRVRQIVHTLRAHRLDVAILLLVIAGLLEVAIRWDSPNAPQSSPWFVFPAIAALALPLLARRGHPFAAAAGFWLLAAALSFVDGRLVTFPIGVFFVGMVASFLLGGLRDGRHAHVGLGIVLGCSVIVVYNQPEHSAGSFAFIPMIFGITWLAGYTVRERAEQTEAAEERAIQAERERDAAARIAVAEERARIARELHDVVAHAVSVMVLQTGAVRHKLPEELGDEADALRGVEKTGRTALAEMRRLLGAMRREGEDVELGPQPGLEALDGLLAEVGRSGLPVRVHVDGEPFALPPAIDLSAYRIVQEGLTNALKHARATQADVTLRYTPDELQIEVRDDGRGSSGANGSGYGLVGIRERVKIFGGEMTAETESAGGFVLSTRLPLDEIRR